MNGTVSGVLVVIQDKIRHDCTKWPNYSPIMALIRWKPRPSTFSAEKRFRALQSLHDRSFLENNAEIDVRMNGVACVDSGGMSDTGAR